MVGKKVGASCRSQRGHGGCCGVGDEGGLQAMVCQFNAHPGLQPASSWGGAPADCFQSPQTTAPPAQATLPAHPPAHLDNRLSAAVVPRQQGVHHGTLRGEGMPLPRALVAQQAVALGSQVGRRLSRQWVAATLRPLGQLGGEVGGAGTGGGHLTHRLGHLCNTRVCGVGWRLGCGRQPGTSTWRPDMMYMLTQSRQCMAGNTILQQLPSSSTNDASGRAAPASAPAPPRHGSLPAGSSRCAAMWCPRHRAAASREVGGTYTMVGGQHGAKGRSGAALLACKQHACQSGTATAMREEPGGCRRQHPWASRAPGQSRGRPGPSP